MSYTNYLVCPQCNNKYRLPTELTQCSFCGANLVRPADSSSINTRSARNIRGNSGPVILGDGNTVYDQAKPEVTYDFHPTGTLSALRVGRPVLGWLTLGGFLMWLIHTSGSIASILSIFGTQIKIEELKPLSPLIPALQSWIYGNRWPLTLALIGILIYLMKNQIDKISKLNNGEYVHASGSTFYEKARDTFLKGSMKGECPSKSCSGALTVRRVPFDNEEGIRIVGICDQQPNLHRYTIDLKTLQGEWVKLTKKEKPNNNQTKR